MKGRYKHMLCNSCKKSFNDEFSFCPWCGRESSVESTFPTLKQVYTEWKNELYPNLGKSMIANYECAWKKLSEYYDIRIDALKTRHFQTIVSQMASTGYSRSSIEKVRTLMSQLCKYALKNDWINKNYGSFLTLPKKKKGTRDRFSDVELAELWQHTNLRTVRIILILAYTGLRANELFGLQRATVFPYDSIPYLIGGGKTEAGTDRTIVISPLILDFIRDEYNKNAAYLIPNSIGGRIDLHNWRKRQYYPTLDQLNLPKRDIHCLRHTFASLMFKAGANQKALAELMGHAHISTTADIYAHTDFDQLLQAISLLKKPIVP